MIVRLLEAADPCENIGGGVARLRPLIWPDWPRSYDIHWNSLFWRWIESHPLANEVHRWVLTTDNQEVVGHLAALPQYYRINGHRVFAHTPSDYRVLPQYGFHAIPLMRTFFRACKNCVACDMPLAPVKIETRLGAEETGKLYHAVKVLKLPRIPLLPAWVPAPTPRLLNRGLRAIDRALIGGSEDDFQVEMIEQGFDESFDELFESVATAIPCVPEKDAAFLRWRYGPGSPQSPVTVLGVRSERILIGYAVLKVTWEEQASYILDLMTLPGRQDVAGALLREAVRYSIQVGVDLVRYDFLGSPASPRLEDLWRLGFFFREKGRHTLLVKFADRTLHTVACNPAHWSYNLGDGEASFYH